MCLLKVILDLGHFKNSKDITLPYMGTDNRVRTVTVPAGVKARIDQWTAAAGITEGRLFRPVTKGGVMKGTAILDEKVIWRLVVHYARETELGKLAPHDLRRTCAKLCRRAGGNPALMLTVLYATERNAPKGRDRIDWKLVTDLPVRTRREAIES